MQEMVIDGFGESHTGALVLVLRTTDERTVILIMIGNAEAMAISIKLEGVSPRRPLTHDLLASIVTQLDVRVTHVAITEVRESLFYAVIALVQGENMIPIDARPSDVIALAVRVDAPIYVADDVLEKYGLPREDIVPAEGSSQEEIDTEVSKFRGFLDDAWPEDFSTDLDNPS